MEEKKNDILNKAQEKEEKSREGKRLIILKT